MNVRFCVIICLVFEWWITFLIDGASVDFVLYLLRMKKARLSSVLDL